jgi:hypothetical protein
LVAAADDSDEVDEGIADPTGALSIVAGCPAELGGRMKWKLKFSSYCY